FETDFSKATVITMFLLPSINMQLRPKLLALKPGTRIVSNTFTMEDWEADDRAKVYDSCTTYCTAYLWVVPANVDGAWRSPQGDLFFAQKSQMIRGTLGGATIMDAKLRGDEVTFTAGPAQYSGHVKGNTIEGTMSAEGKTSSWRATR